MTVEPEVAKKTITDREQFFEQLYEDAFPKIAAFVRKMDGTLEDAKDIFHDALIIFYKKTVANRLSIHLSSEAYLLGIAKHLWLRKFKQDRGKVTLGSLELEITIPEDYFTDPVKPNLLKLIEFTGKKCLDLLRSYYYDMFDMRKIAQSFGYASERSATVQKYKCMEKIRNKIKDNKLNYEDFTS